MEDFKIAHVLRNRIFPGGRITGLGICNDGLIFNIELATIIEKMKQGFKFHVEAAGYKAYIELATHPVTGREYVKTIGDTSLLDNLEALPQKTYGTSGSWPNPTKLTYLPFWYSFGALHRRYNSTFPMELDTHGTGHGCAEYMPIGFSDYYESGFTGHISCNSLFRGYIAIDGLDTLENKKIIKATVTLALKQTVNHNGANASNVGSALNSVWRLLGPWVKFVTPFQMPAIPIVTNVPAWGGTNAPAAYGAASYDSSSGTIVFEATSSLEYWRTGVQGNYGLMLLGPDESEREDNDAVNQRPIVSRCQRPILSSLSGGFD